MSVNWCSFATIKEPSIDAGQAVQDVPFEKLEQRLLADKQVLRFAGKRNVVIGIGSLKGVTRDDAQIANKGTWTYSNSKSPFVEYGYRHDGNTQKGKLTAKFSVKLPKSGSYEVRMYYTSDPNRATNVPVTIQHAGGEAKTVVN